MFLKLEKFIKIERFIDDKRFIESEFNRFVKSFEFKNRIENV